MGTLGAMQDFPLRIMRLMDHAEREHGTREIVAARADGTTVRTNWKNLAQDARKIAQALERLGVQPGERVATLAMNHDRHLATWFGVAAMKSMSGLTLLALQRPIGVKSKPVVWIQTVNPL